jgi:hypothetical protein
MRPLFLAFALAFATLGPAHGADRAPPSSVPAADFRSVRAVIEAQLDAFGADDADRAFSFAAPSIRQMFGSAERFIEMVRSSYPAVYRPASVAFLVPERQGPDVVQGVHLTDRNGTLWLAVYQLQRQPDGAWRIGGCQLVEASGRST